MIKRLLLLLTLCFGIVSSAAFAQDETEDLTDYKTACLAAIDNISLIGDNFAMNSMITIAKTSLDLCSTKDGMRRVMTTLRAGVLAYLKTVSAFQDGQVFTGLVGNHSFDTGDLSLWYSIGFDLSQIGLSDITNAIGSGDVSGLVDAVSINNWNEDTKAIENEGSNAVSGGDQKYYLNSSQLMMQPLLGLPAGIYSFSAKVACKPGLLRLNKVHLNALVVSTNVVQEILGDVLSSTTDWGELLSNFDMTQYIGVFLNNGKLYTESASCKNLNTFSDGELRFMIDDGDIVIIGMNAGLVPFIGTEQYRADNLQLTGLRAADNILTPAKTDLAAALQDLSEIEANYNADAESTTVQPAFTFDKTITENYNNAYRTAKDKYENDKLTDILTKNDLSNIDGLDATLKNHYSKDIQTLEKAKATFDKQGFIAPKANEVFNIVMRDDWITLFSKWTGNAVSIDEDMSLRFSQKPGESIFALPFGFERASDTYTNQLRAFVYDYRDKYYLGKSDNKFVLSTDPSEAVTITAMLSYTEEGDLKLMNDDMYLGTSYTSNDFIATDNGSFLRPTRTGLTVAPAQEMELTVTVPAGMETGTLMLPFDADLPEGVNAFTVTGINAALPYLEKEAMTNINGNTPYVIMAAAGNYTFSGVPHAVLPSYDEGLLIGRHTPCTTQGTNEYKLTTEEGFSVFKRMDGQPVAANECYLKCDSPDDIIFVNQTDAATGINAIDNERRTIGNAIYNLSGQRLAKPQRGLNIINGKKVAY